MKGTQQPPEDHLPNRFSHLHMGKQHNRINDTAVEMAHTQVIGLCLLGFRHGRCDSDKSY